MPTKYENAIEIISQSVFEYLEDENDRKEANELILLVAQAYIPVLWPNVQEYMEEDWFNREAILDIDMKFGDSAYLIPIQRVMNFKS